MAKTSRKPDGRPSLQWYTGDWLEEPSLKLCDLSARGLWIDLLCHAFKMEDRGYLRVNGHNLGSKGLAALVGRPEAEVKQALEQLVYHGVCETAEDGCIYNRRMVRDEKQRRSKVEAGSKGGKVSKPPNKGSKKEAKGGSTTPSTSSSPTSATTTEKEKTRKELH